MRREGMPEQVRIDALRQALGAGSRGHPQLHRARAQGPASPRNEQRLTVRAGEARALGEPAAQCLDRLATDRGDALLAALAQYLRAALIEVQILELETGQ